jgi:dGTP triphosphohydrolase
MVKKRPLKRISIAANEVNAKTVENRLASIRPKNENKPTLKSKEDRHPPTLSKANKLDKQSIAVTIKVKGSLFNAMIERHPKIDNNETYFQKFLGKQVLKSFRTNEWKNKDKNFIHAVKQYCSSYGDELRDIHRARVVISNSEIKTLHEFCGDPMQVLTNTRCINAILVALANDIASAEGV